MSRTGAADDQARVIEVQVGRVLLAWRRLVEFGQQPGQRAPLGRAHPSQLASSITALLFPVSWKLAGTGTSVSWKK